MENDDSKDLVNDEIDKFEKDLDKYEQSLGVNVTVNEATKTSLQKVFEVDINKLSDDECRHLVFDLSKYSLFLQKECNKYRARIKYVENKIWHILSRAIQQQSGFKFEEKYYQAVSGNVVAGKWHNAKLVCEARLTRINYIVNNIDSVRQSLLFLLQARNRNV